VFGDADYLSIQKRAEHKHRKNVSWFIAKRPGTRKKLVQMRLTRSIFGYGKMRYRGLSKNTNRLHLLAAFTNLMIGEKYLLA